MAKRLLLVRHGRIAAAHAGQLIGATDLPLDAIGERQAVGLSERLARWSPQRCYASPMLRCRQTVAAAIPGGNISFDDDLREINLGEFEGLTFPEIASRYPSVVAQWAELGDDFVFPGGESLHSFLERVYRAADRLAGDDATTVLAVTHGGVIRAMICHFLGIEPRQYVLFDVGFATTVAIDLFDGRGVLSAMERLDLSEDGHD
jgi:broad specificity phosphatase PhoE